MKKINLENKIKSLIKSLTILKQLYPHSTPKDELIEKMAFHKIPVSPIYLSAYKKAGVISMNETHILIKDPTLLDQAYKIVRKDPLREQELKKISDYKKFLEERGYVVIKKTSNIQILVCNKIY